MYKIVITQPAEADFKKAVQYVNIELQNPTAARLLVDDIEKAINTLSDMPHSNPLVRDAILSERGLRILVVKNYLVFYIVREPINSVVIQRILYSRRDWESLLYNIML